MLPVVARPRVLHNSLLISLNPAHTLINSPFIKFSSIVHFSMPSILYGTLTNTSEKENKKAKRNKNKERK